MISRYAAIIATCVTVLCAAGQPAAVLVARAPVVVLSADSKPSRTWLALGDSYSAGTGIDGPLVSAGKDCRRADGSQTRADGSHPQAWAVTAYQSVREKRGFTNQYFVACNGAITDDVFKRREGNPIPQYDEAAAFVGSQHKWDVVSFTFGGNNARFADVIKGCVAVDLVWGQPFVPECAQDESTLNNRVDQLTRRPGASGADLVGNTDIPSLLDEIASHVAPGGEVIMVGYPRLFSVPWWSRFVGDGTCEGVSYVSTSMLNRVVDRLNNNLKATIDEANESHATSKITFTFVDVADKFDGHGLCGTNERWMNGTVFSGKDVTSWYHPNQRGHDAEAELVAAAVKPGDTSGAASSEVADNAPVDLPNHSYIAAPPAAASPVPDVPAYRSYGVDRYGFSTELPASFTLQSSPTNGDGVKLQSNDGQAVVTLYGENNLESRDIEVTETMYASTAEAQGGTVTFRTASGNQATVTGIMPGQRPMVFYYHIYSGAGSDNVIYWLYPVSVKAVYDEALTHSVKAFQVGDLTQPH
jgi:hypothetical protein